jgi:hypothetical protein
MGRSQPACGRLHRAVTLCVHAANIVPGSAEHFERTDENGGATGRGGEAAGMLAVGSQARAGC